jgi:cell division protein FtsB
VEKLLEEWEEAVHEGTLSGDEESAFIKLARERIEIEQQIADLQDHENR